MLTDYREHGQDMHQIVKPSWLKGSATAKLALLNSGSHRLRQGRPKFLVSLMHPYF